MTVGRVAWVMPRGYPWWPAFVCDPAKVDPDLHKLETKRGKNIVEKAMGDLELALVYYFGSHDFGLHRASTLQPWNGPGHSTMLGLSPCSMKTEEWVVKRFTLAIHEVEQFIQAHAVDKSLLPYLHVDSDGSDDETDATAVVDVNKAGRSLPPPALASHGAIGWALTDDFPFLPVRVIDPQRVQPGLKPAEYDCVQRVLDAPEVFTLVYVFGRHTLKAVESIHAWKGPRHNDFLRGCPKNLSNPNNLLVLPSAMVELEVYLDTLEKPSTPPDTTLGTTSNVMPPTATRPASAPSLAVPRSMVWVRELQGRWYPAFLCNSQDLNLATLDHVGGGLSQQDLEHSRKFASFRIVYRFGQRRFAKLPPGSLIEPWDSDSREVCVKKFKAKNIHAFRDIQKYILRARQHPDEDVVPYETIA